MLLILLDFLRYYLIQHGESGDLGPLRVFQYITVRAGSALLTAFAVSLILGPALIDRLRALKAGQPVRKAIKAGAISLHDMHGKKEGTPTMGGLLIMAAVFIPVAIFCRLGSESVLMISAMSLGFGAIGFWDDYTKVMKKNHLGVSARGKLVSQTALGVLLGVVLWQGDWAARYDPAGAAGDGYAYLLVPFFKNFHPHLGILFVFWAALVMVCSSNAVNLTDGLDGLAIGTTAVSAAAFGVVAYMASRVDLSLYLFIPYIPDAGEIVVFAGALLGASLGFLWFNAHPAQVFMGDTGSMMLGGALGTIALLVKQEFLLVVVGGVFVAEAVSVIVQVTGFKLTGKRILRMSPLHHHYEKCGLHENKIIIRFWTVSILLALVGLATLKLR